MRTCRVCQHSFEEGKGNCPNCNFAYIVVLGEEHEAQISQLADSYRNDRLDEVKIGISLWELEMNDQGEYELVKTEKNVAQGKELREKQTVWLEDCIANAGEISAEVELYSTKANGRKEYAKTEIALPNAMNPWKLGVERTPDGLIRICLKNDHQIVTSEAVNVL